MGYTVFNGTRNTTLCYVSRTSNATATADTLCLTSQNQSPGESPDNDVTTIIAANSSDPRIGEIDALARHLERVQLQLLELEGTGKDIRGRILAILVEDDLDTVSTVHGQCQHVRRPVLSFRSSAVTTAQNVVQGLEKDLKLAKAALKAAQDSAQIQGKAKVEETKHELRFVMPR